MNVRRAVVLALASLLAFTARAAAEPTAHAAATCADFPNQAAAQRAHNTRDADGDGIYCESLPCPCLKPGQGTPRRQAAVSPVRCGVERWPVKTAQDKRSALIDLTPKPTSVDTLRGLTAPGVGAHTPRIAGVETTVYRVRARLVEFKGEDDGDIHLVIAAPGNSAHTMIVEFPNSHCLAKTGPTKRRRIVAARTALVRACGTPSSSHFTSLAGTATIDGVGFFDIKHGTPQRGVAPNGIELHPVMRFRGACT